MPPSRSLPATIGHYTVLKELGRGGMGVVYLAEDKALDRKVAIKMMLPQTAKKAHARERFLREARAMGRIKSDHVITVHGINEDENQPYFVMPFLEGQPLDKRLESDDPLPFKTILDLCIDFAQGVADAHAEGVIHRDLKPANLFVEAPKNRGKVLDFGLTRISENTKVSQVGALIGSLSYMPLEQASRQPVDHRADIYSLGVVFYEMCTRTLPFDADTEVQILYALMKTEPRRVEQLNREVPPKFAELIHRMLQREAIDRPQSMTEVLEVLRSLRSESTITVAEIPTPATRSIPKPEAIRETASIERTIRITPRRVGAKPKSTPSTYPWLKYGAPALGICAMAVILMVILGGSSGDGEAAKSIALNQQEEDRLKEATRLRMESLDREAKLKKLEVESRMLLTAEQQKFQAEIERLKREKEEADRLRADLEKKLTLPEVEKKTPPKELPKPEVKIAAQSPARLDCTNPKGADAVAVKRAQKEWADYLGVPTETNVDLGRGVTMMFVLIPPGKFVMGAPASEAQSQPAERPVHEVTITKAFYLGKYEVTQQEYVQLTGLANPSNFKSEVGAKHHPVEEVSWENAMFAAEKLSAKPLPKGFGRSSLPTDAQWEYACRAGTRTVFHFGNQNNGKDANCDGNVPYDTTKKGTYLRKTTPVGSYQPNAFGLFDMHGNVFEWCLDGWDANAYDKHGKNDPFIDYSSTSKRLLRGGSWNYVSGWSRSAVRSYYAPEPRIIGFVGFRLVLLP